MKKQQFRDVDFLFFFNFYSYFILLCNTVLVLPYIDMWIFYLVLLSDWPVDLDLDSGTHLSSTLGAILSSVIQRQVMQPWAMFLTQKNLALISEVCLLLLLNMLNWKKQAGIKITGRNINNLRYADDTTLMGESEEQLKSLLKKVRGEWKTWLKTTFKKRRSWHLFPSFHGKEMGKQWKQWETLFLGGPQSLQMLTAVMKLKDAYSLGLP